MQGVIASCFKKHPATQAANHSTMQDVLWTTLCQHWFGLNLSSFVPEQMELQPEALSVNCRLETAGPLQLQLSNLPAELQLSNLLVAAAKGAAKGAERMAQHGKLFWLLSRHKASCCLCSQRGKPSL